MMTLGGRRVGVEQPRVPCRGGGGGSLCARTWGAGREREGGHVLLPLSRNAPAPRTAASSRAALRGSFIPFLLRGEGGGGCARSPGVVPRLPDFTQSSSLQPARSAPVTLQRRGGCSCATLPPVSGGSAPSLSPVPLRQLRGPGGAAVRSPPQRSGCRGHPAAPAVPASRCR